MMADMVKGIDYPGIGVVFFCHDGNGKYICHKRSMKTRDERGCWDVGGGGVKHGELLEDALRREVKEEYGADILEYEYLGFREVHRVIDGMATHWIVFDFKVRVDPDTSFLGDPEKIDVVEWFTLDAIPHPQHSQLPPTIEKYKTRLIS